MQTGKIVRIMDNGFGFIKTEGQDKNIFFHMNELQNVDFDALNEEDTLEFEVENGPKGESAVNISRV